MTDKETRRKIVIEYGAGATVTALSEKYKLSRTTISKILGSVKTEQKLSNNCSKTERVGVAIGRVKEIDEQDNKELARKTVNAIMSSLPNDIKRASIADKMKVLERMVELFGFNEEDEQTESLFVVNGQVVAKQDEYKLAAVKEAERQYLIAEKKALLLKYREDVEQVDLFGMVRNDYDEKKAACRTLVEELRELEKGT